MQTNQCDYFILATLDSIAWLLNLRGNDILYTPLNLAYAIITPDTKVELFVDEEKFLDIKNNLSKFDFIEYTSAQR